jgi:hypothetical protein
LTTSRTGKPSTLPSTKLAWSPQAGPQTALVKCPADEIFYGGARGGGKTDGMLGKFAIKAFRYGENCVGVFFRRTREDLKEAIERSKQIYGPIGAKWSEQKKWWTFPNGARLKFEYLDKDADADNYQGHNYTDVFFEELTHWASPDPVNKLRATLRSAAGIPCQFHATGNPGGPGHQWVKARYITPAPMGWALQWEDFTNPFTGEVVRKNRVFIPSKLSDNRYLGSGYVANLFQSGSKELVKPGWLATGMLLRARSSIAGTHLGMLSGRLKSEGLDAVSFWRLGLCQAVLVWLVGCCRRQVQDAGWPMAASRLHRSISRMVRHDAGEAECWA